MMGSLFHKQTSTPSQIDKSSSALQELLHVSNALVLLAGTVGLSLVWMGVVYACHLSESVMLSGAVALPFLALCIKYQQLLSKRNDRFDDNETLQRAIRRLNAVSMVLPKRIAEEEVGDCFENIAVLCVSNRPAWYVELYVWTSIVRFLLNATRDRSEAELGFDFDSASAARSRDAFSKALQTYRLMQISNECVWVAQLEVGSKHLKADTKASAYVKHLDEWAEVNFNLHIHPASKSNPDAASVQVDQHDKIIHIRLPSEQHRIKGTT